MRLFRGMRMLAGAMLAAAIGAGPAGAQQQPPPHWPKSMVLGTAAVGGTYFIYGQGWANLVNEKLGTNISTQQTQGPNQNLILTDRNDVQLGMITMGVGHEGWTGEGDWTQGRKHQNVRAIFPMYDTPFHMIVLARSDIKGFKDLNGKRVGVGPRAGTPGTFYPRFFKDLGLNVTVRNGSGSDMASQLADGLIDAFAFAAGLPIAAFSELEAQHQVRYVTFTEDERKLLLGKYPSLAPSMVPAGTYRQLKEDHPTVGVYNFAIAHKDLPDDLVYAIVKTIMENPERMKQIHASAVETVPQNADKNTFMTWHPGAVRYYREKGIALPEATLPKS